MQDPADALMDLGLDPVTLVRCQEEVRKVQEDNIETVSAEFERSRAA